MTFCGLTREFFDLCKQQSDNVIVNNALSEQMTKLNGTMFFQNLDCYYIIPDHFNHTVTSSSSAVELCFMLKYSARVPSRQLCVNCWYLSVLSLMLTCCTISIWSYNVEFYKNILPDYNFYYELPAAD